MYSKNVPKGICIVDTPGMLENWEYWESRMIWFSDIIVFVMRAVLPFTSHEKKKIDELLDIGYDKEKIWFVFTGMDQITSEAESVISKFKKMVHSFLSRVYEDENGRFD